MKIIGITGGIGSGKTTVCRIFAALSVPVFYADEEAKRIYQNENIKEQVRNLLGAEAYSENGLDRTFVAKKVFSDKVLLEKLNSVIHPAVQSVFHDWCKKNNSSAYILKEAAILFESGSDKDCASVITVIAPFELKIERIKRREKISSEDIEKRMRNQWSDEEKIKRSAFIIKNDEQESLIRQVLTIHNKLSGTKKNPS